MSINDATTDYEDKEVNTKYIDRTKVHWYGLYPSVLNNLGDVKGKKVLDVGCGNGDLSIALAKSGAEVIGIDISQDWINKCNLNKEKLENVNFVLMNGEDLSKFKKEEFDIVLMNMVLLNVPTIEKVERVISETSRVIKKNGTFMFSDLHPICKMSNAHITRKTIYGEGFSYFKDGSDFTAVVDDNGSVIEFKDKHWTFETLTKILEKNNFSVYRIIEPNYLPDSPKELLKWDIPEFILFFCRKLK